MRAHHRLARSRAGSPRGPRTHKGTIIPEAVDTMSGTDLDHHPTVTGEGQVAVPVAVDHRSAALGAACGIAEAISGSRYGLPEPFFGEPCTVRGGSPLLFSMFSGVRGRN